MSLTKRDKLDMLERRNRGESLRSIAADYGVSHMSVRRSVDEVRVTAPVEAVELMPHERTALIKVLGEISAGPGFQDRWSGLDLMTVAYALRRVSGVDLVG